MEQKECGCYTSQSIFPTECLAPILTDGTHLIEHEASHAFIMQDEMVQGFRGNADQVE